MTPSTQARPSPELLQALENIFAEKFPHLRPNGPRIVPEMAPMERAALKNMDIH
ncbi:MAG: hypothetical protein ABIG94_03870 [Pseudomonadota bacterium]